MEALISSLSKEKGLLIDPALGTTRKSTGKSRFNC
jgi:hypothetical protein